VNSYPLPLAGVRVVEVSSFVAAPLCGMTLTQLGADVVRVDPMGGAADYHRWPVTADGVSIYWAGLNKGKRSLAVDFRSAEAQNLVQRLIVDSGVLLTNAAGRDWLGYETLSRLRGDLIHLEVLGRADGTPAVDYTVNAATGFPLITGTGDLRAPVNTPMPAWDVACGLYAALAITAAVRQRDLNGHGARISLPLENVALAIAGNLGFLSEAQINGTERPRIGNAIFGTYGSNFTSSDGAEFMVVALTTRHFRDLATVTGSRAAVEAIEQALGADFTDEGQRYRHRDALTGLFAVWFREHTGEEIDAALSQTSVLYARYRSFVELARDEKLADNPLFRLLRQPRIGEYLAPGLPMSFDGQQLPVEPAPTVGDDTAAVLTERLGLDAQEISRLMEEGIIA
jgi:2-methylfumaryl-CoA isomerase